MLQAEVLRIVGRGDDVRDLRFGGVERGGLYCKLACIARFDGNRVYLSTPPSPDPLTGTMTMRTMTWEKVT